MKYINLNILRRIVKANAFSNFLNLGSVQLYNTLLSFLLYPVITRKFGLEAFGLFTTANYFAGLMGTLVNYGTSQSGVKDVVMAKNDPKSVAAVFYNILTLRLFIFIAFISCFSLLFLGDLPNYNFYLFSVPIVFSEVLNPMFFYLGKENLSLYNISNLISKILIILSVLFLINGTDDAIWINFSIGTINTLVYLSLIINGIFRYRLLYTGLNRSELVKLSVNNFYLVGNNLSVHLQQSFMVFTISLWGNPMWLGAYSICDKIIGAVKMLISSISNAIYPKAAYLFMEGKDQFIRFKNRMKKSLVLTFFGVSLGIMIFSDAIIHLINGEPNATAVTLLRIMAFLPTLAAFNALNVLELLIRDHNIYIFKIAIVLLVLAICLSLFIVNMNMLLGFGAYTLIIEFSAILMYEYVIRKNMRSYIPSD